MSSIEIIKKAMKGKPLVENYTIKYLNDMIQLMGQKYKRSNIDEGTERTF